MGVATRSKQPKFGSAVLWGACSRCNARVKYSTLKRERLTGLLVCSRASGRPVNPCWDPWPDVYDFQLSPDRSIEPPAEPLPLRYNLDNIWGSAPDTGTTTTFANAPTPAPDDTTRLNAIVKTVPYYKLLGASAAFTPLNPPLPYKITEVTQIVAANYDGTFIPSNSVRTVTPPDESAELTSVKTDPSTGNLLWTPPWAQIKKV